MYGMEDKMYKYFCITELIFMSYAFYKAFMLL